MPLLISFPVPSFNPLNGLLSCLSISLTGLSVVTVLLIVWAWLLHHPIPGVAHNWLGFVLDAPSLLLSVRRSHDTTAWLGKQSKRLASPLVQVFPRPWERRPWVLVSDFATAHEVLSRRTGSPSASANSKDNGKDKDKDFDRSDFISDGLAFMGGAHSRAKTGTAGWATMRAWLQDLMTPSCLYDVAGPHHVEPTARKLLTLWESKARLARGRPFAVAEDCMAFSLDVMLAFMFGEEFTHSALGPQIAALKAQEKFFTWHQCEGYGGNGVIEFSRRARDEFLVACEDTCDLVECIINAWAPKPTLWWLRLTQGRRARNMLDVKQRVIERQIRAALDRVKAATDSDAALSSATQLMVARELRLAEKESREPQPLCQDMVDEVYNQLLSGYHTTGAAVAWLVKFLARHPHVQTRLRDELRAAFPDRTELRFGDIHPNPGLHYLHAVVDESLRLYGNTVTRSTTRDTTLLGRNVRKGTLVFLLDNGHNESEFGNGIPLKEFAPERWLDGDGRFNPAAVPSLTFGAGPRGCFGKRLAYMEMYTVAAMLVWRFDVLPPPSSLDGDEAEGGISYKPRSACVSLRVRQ